MLLTISSTSSEVQDFRNILIPFLGVIMELESDLLKLSSIYSFFENASNRALCSCGSGVYRDLIKTFSIRDGK